MTWDRGNLTEASLVGKPLAVADTVALFEMSETPFLSRVSPSLRNLPGADGTGSLPYGQRTFKFKERVLRHNHTTLNGAVSSGVTTFVLSDSICRAGDQIVVDDEVILLGSTSDNLTFTGCTRSVGTGADQNHSSGDDVFVFGTSYAEHQNFPTGGPVFHSAEVTTYTDILMESFDFSGSAQEVELYAEPTDAMLRAGADTMVILKKQLEQRVLFSSAQAPSGSATAGKMLGVYERVAATNYVDLGGVAPQFESIQQAVRKCTRWGGLKSGRAALFVSDYTAHTIDSWGIAHVQGPAEAQAIFGTDVRAIRIGDKILEIYVANEANFLENHLLASTDAIGVGPQSPKREFALYISPKTGDFDLATIMGEYTCAVQGVYAHCWLLNAKFAA